MARKLGILAGSGTLPRRLAELCRQDGQEVFLLAFEGQTDPQTVEGLEHAWIRLGAAAEGVRRLKEAGVGRLVMAGPIKRPSLGALRPDWRTAKWIAKVGSRALGDDGLLRSIIGELESEGFEVVGLDQLFDHFLAQAKTYGRHVPDSDAQRDIERGLAVARALGSADVGQAVIVQQGIVLALEAIEGTDAMVARAGDLRREGPGGVLVKLKKPGQERRADLPTIGVQTVRGAAAAGLRGIAVEAGQTLVIDAEAVTAAADEAGMFLVGLALESQ
ncbi:MAG: UDP-2,3-diacylglucosamine diphosphatase LpxI [Pseudomonadota bacterium]